MQVDLWVYYAKVANIGMNLSIRSIFGVGMKTKTGPGTFDLGIIRTMNAIDANETLLVDSMYHSLRASVEPYVGRRITLRGLRAEAREVQSTQGNEAMLGNVHTTLNVTIKRRGFSNVTVDTTLLEHPTEAPTIIVILRRTP